MCNSNPFPYWNLHLAVRIGVLFGLSSMLTSIIMTLLILSQRGVVSLFGEKQVIPLIAYFDKRPSDGHENTTVILAQVETGLLAGDEIIGAKLWVKPALSFEIVLNGRDNYFYRLSPSVTHYNIVVFCYDLQIPSIQAKPFITYRTRNAYNYPINVVMLLR